MKTPILVTTESLRILIVNEERIVCFLKGYPGIPILKISRDIMYFTDATDAEEVEMENRGEIFYEVGKALSELKKWV